MQNLINKINLDFTDSVNGLRLKNSFDSITKERLIEYLQSNTICEHLDNSKEFNTGTGKIEVYCNDCQRFVC